MTTPFEHIYQQSADGTRFVQFRIYGEIVNMELLEGEASAEAISAAMSTRLLQVQGVPFYVCRDSFGDIFALACVPYAARFNY